MIDDKIIKGSDQWRRVLQKKQKLIRLAKGAGFKIPKFKMFVTERDRGTCYHDAKVITLPRFSLEEGDSHYFDFYSIHELSHLLCDVGGHCPEFYEIFYKLCPKKYWYWELNYQKKAFSSFLKSKGYDILTVPDESPTWIHYHT